MCTSCPPRIHTHTIPPDPQTPPQPLTYIAAEWQLRAQPQDAGAPYREAALQRGAAAQARWHPAAHAAAALDGPQVRAAGKAGVPVPCGLHPGNRAQWHRRRRLLCALVGCGALNKSPPARSLASCQPARQPTRMHAIPPVLPACLPACLPAALPYLTACSACLPACHLCSPALTTTTHPLTRPPQPRGQLPQQQHEHLRALVGRTRPGTA